MSDGTREQKELQEARTAYLGSFGAANEEDPPEGGTPVVEAPVPEPPAPESTEGQPAQETPGETHSEGEKTPEPDDELTRLKKEHESLQRQFRAIQAAITPAQQERAELRRQKQALEEKLAAYETRVHTSGDEQAKKLPLTPQLQAQLDAVREVMPEVADLLMAQIEDQKRTEGDLVSRFEAQELKRHEEIAKNAMAELYRQRPEAQQVASDPNFWTWIDTQGPASATFREILAAPWAQDLDHTIAILDAYTGTRGVPSPMGAPSRPASPPATVPAVTTTAPVPAVARPTDLSVPTRGATRASTTGGTPILSDSQTDELERSLRRAGREESAKIADRIRESYRQRARM